MRPTPITIRWIILRLLGIPARHVSLELCCDEAGLFHAVLSDQCRRRFETHFTYKQVFNGLSVTLAGSEAQQAKSLAALKALPQVCVGLTHRYLALKATTPQSWIQDHVTH